jgi:uncharacterized protein YecE (DUF72 family)
MKRQKEKGVTRKRKGIKKGVILVGTSGWQYKHWRGVFYPKGLKTAEEFKYYLSLFDTVEINNSFYKLPEPATFSGWNKSAPDGFTFAVKASRFITHMKKLKMTREEIQKFFLHLRKLKDKLGPILFQLPPLWKVNAERLAAFCSILPKNFRYAFEFRNTTWYTEEVYKVLRKYNAAFCIYHLSHHISPIEVTSDFVYIRLHGPGEKYQGEYKAKELEGWAERCLEWQRSGKDVFVYFDNDQAGYAVRNARQLKELLQQRSY